MLNGPGSLFSFTTPVIYGDKFIVRFTIDEERLEFLKKHQKGDHGDVSELTKAKNTEALSSGSGVIWSQYVLPGENLVVLVNTTLKGGQHQLTKIYLSTDAYCG